MSARQLANVTAERNALAVKVLDLQKELAAARTEHAAVLVERDRLLRHEAARVAGGEPLHSW